MAFFADTVAELARRLDAPILADPQAAITGPNSRVPRMPTNSSLPKPGRTRSTYSTTSTPRTSAVSRCRSIRRSISARTVAFEALQRQVEAILALRAGT